MTSYKKRGNTLCIVSFLIVLLGIGIYCIFKPPLPKEQIQIRPEEQIRTSIEDINPPTSNFRGEVASLPDDNMELIDA